MTWRLRPAQPLDAGRLGSILSDATAESPWLPPESSGAEAIGHAGTMIERGWVTVAEQGGRAVGFLARDGGVIHALFLSPAARGQGIGAWLLADAKSRSGGALHLWTYAANRDAQRFYRREGFAETHRVARPDPSAPIDALTEVHFLWHRQETP